MYSILFYTHMIIHPPRYRLKIHRRWNEISLWHMTYCNIDDDILRADDVDLNLFRARRVNGRARMAINSPPSFATVSQIGQDIFHSRLSI